MSKRVAFLLPDLRGGGVERLTIELMEGFLRRGVEVDLVLLQNAGDLLHLVPERVKVVDLAVPRLRAALFAFRRYLKEKRPDAVWVAMWPLTVIAVAAAFGLRRRPRIVVSEHAMLTRQYAGKRIALAAMRVTMRATYARADGVVGVSGAVSAEIAHLAGLPRSRVVTIHNPVSPPLVSGVQPDSLWNGHRGKRLLSVGSFKSAKNHRLLVDAFSRVAAREDAVLAIVGTGDLRDDLEYQVARLGLSDRILLPGFCATPGDWYAGADLFVLSSDHEGFGNVLVEAMHCGLPVVSTDCPGGPAEALGGGKWGTLVPPGNAEALAQAMIAALHRPADPTAQRARASEFTAERAVDAYARLAEIL